MICPETRNACFDLDCQLNGCQGDGIRRATASVNGEQPVPRSIPDPENDRYRREQIRADILNLLKAA